MPSLKTSAVDLIAAERQRQVNAEGWTPTHDDTHVDGELALAAACYLITQPHEFTDFYWPWDHADFKPSPDDRVRELVKAGALITAEIDRLERLALEEARRRLRGLLGTEQP